MLGGVLFGPIGIVLDMTESHRLMSLIFTHSPVTVLCCHVRASVLSAVCPLVSPLAPARSFCCPISFIRWVSPLPIHPPTHPTHPPRMSPLALAPPGMASILMSAAGIGVRLTSATLPPQQAPGRPAKVHTDVRRAKRHRKGSSALSGPRRLCPWCPPRALAWPLV